MNQSQYTPGPWLQSHRKALGGYRTEVYTADGEVIATVAWYPRRLNETTTGTDREGNARLISAAPDLLDDLREAAATLRRYEALHRAKNTEDSTAKAEVNAALASRFEATIAKATQ